MDIGVALPQMARGLTREAVTAWCRGIDEGPYSSVSAGERITFHNLEGISLCTAAAMLTERVRIFLNVAVAPWHAPAMLAKQLATIDVLSNGRVDVAVGVGGRQQDYDALGAMFDRRHSRLDKAVGELRRLWAGGNAADGCQIGPAPAQAGGPPILCSGMGQKSLQRAAQWADGVSGFALSGDADEAARTFRLAEQAWANAGRSERPRLVTGVFVALGANAEHTLKNFAMQYLDVFGTDIARMLADAMTLHSPERLRDTIDAMTHTGCDELILVPADTDPAMLDLITEVVLG
jgi:alkanesulfonate monooxygenase SsuD/methylene tetrahydromethanopterin reductase-like flavin-dependent oxidoreductase (luciferase family)